MNDWNVDENLVGKWQELPTLFLIKYFLVK